MNESKVAPERRNVAAIRRKRRGAAMVESMISIPFFITTFVLSIFLGNLYKDKLKTVQESKQAALTVASSNCSSGTGVMKLPSAEDLAFGIAQVILMGAPWTDIFTKGFSQDVQLRDGVVWAGATAHSGPFSVKISTKTAVMCNEKPEKVNFVLVYLWEYVKQALF